MSIPHVAVTMVPGISMEPPPEVAGPMMANFDATGQDPKKSRTVLVMNLDPIMQESLLTNFFETACGKVQHTRICTPIEALKAFRGSSTTHFAFIQFVAQVFSSVILAPQACLGSDGRICQRRGQRTTR